MNRTRARRFAPWLTAILPLALLGTLTAAPAQAHEESIDPVAATTWANYERVTLSTDVGEPIDLAVMPDLRVLHTTRNGQVRLTDPSQGTTVVTNTVDVYANSEDGLQTIALDPAFEDNKWVYLYYAPRQMEAPYPATTPTGSAPNTLPAGQDDSYWDQWKGYNQLSRFKWDDATDSLDMSTEQAIIKVEVQRGQCCHVAGDIAFDADGNLYLSTGDNTPAGTPGANGYAPNNDRVGYNPGFDARRGSGNTDDLRGKILRIAVQEDGSYTIPEGNLFEPGTEKTRPEIFVMGLRNPFRISVDKPTGAVVWGDYGPDAGTANPDRGPMGYVEWQSTTVAINAGWPFCHGPNANYNDWDFETATPGDWYDCDGDLRNPSRYNTGLEQLPSATAPQLWYGDRPDHQPWPEFGSGGQGPMGGPVYRFDHDNEAATKFPEYWDGKAFFGEFSRDYAMAFTIPDFDGPVTKLEPFLPNTALNAMGMPPWDNPMTLEFGPDGSLYVLEYGDGFFRPNPDAGLYRIDYVQGTKGPRADLEASATSGQGPLTVEFSAAGSTHPDDLDLTYAWDLDGSGTFTDGPVEVTRTYTDNGQYTVRLQVTDSGGRVSLTSVVVTVGNTAPTVTIVNPQDGQFADWGDRIDFEVEITDPEDAAIDCSRVLWTYALGHDNTHAHPLFSGSGCTATIEMASEAGHGETENIYGMIGASYTDSGAGDVPALLGDDVALVNPREMQAEHADATSGGTTVVDDETAAGFRKVTSFDAGDWLAYDPVNLAGITGVSVRGAGTGAISLRWGAPDAEAFLTVDIAGGQGWQEVSRALVSPPKGTGRVYVTSTGGVELDQLTFTTQVADVKALLEQLQSDRRISKGAATALGIRADRAIQAAADGDLGKAAAELRKLIDQAGNLVKDDAGARDSLVRAAKAVIAELTQQIDQQGQNA
jgi:glucose/arabinose dehydrogenase/PKD repeat protein